MQFYGKIIGILMFFIVLSSSCNKTNTCSIPNVPVDFTIQTSNPSYFKLNAIGGWVSVTGGSRGIIIYRQSLDQYLAFDRNCTYMPSNANAVISVDSNGITATDTSCGSKFSLYDGGVLKGPAACGLKQYGTSVNGGDLRVYSQ